MKNASDENMQDDEDYVPDSDSESDSDASSVVVSFPVPESSLNEH